VSVTQRQQMVVILSGMFIAAAILVFKLPEDISFGNAVSLAGKMGKLNTVDFNFDWDNRYNFWTGMFASVFLFLSYFGTDQSQVQRYLSGRSLKESRIGLLFNGLLKVPMQFLILFVGILVFVFFQFNRPPVHFNNANLERLEGTAAEARLQELDEEHAILFETQQVEMRELIAANEQGNEAAVAASQAKLSDLRAQDDAIRSEVKELITTQAPEAQTNDRDYVFLTFVINYLPIGIVGLLLAVIFSAAWSSTASELSALSTTTVVDIYRRSFVKDATDRHYLNASKVFTIIWGAIALGFAAIADLFENLIQAVNIIGSLFYGVILGIFFIAFFMKKVKGTATFIAALIGELVVLGIFFLGDIAFLWLNLIGCGVVMLLAAILHLLLGNRPPTASSSEIVA
jgi:Na+/proline symporter